MTPRFGGRWPGNLLLFVASVLASVLVAELGLRAAGHHPFSPRSRDMGPFDRVPGSHARVVPGGVLNAPDPVLGFTNLPGRYQITFANGDAWTTTHGADTLRVSRPEWVIVPQRPTLWIFGCSYVYGWGVNDDATLPWKVQERLPEYDVVNFGVGGYGDVQSLLQFRQALERRARPSVAILAYASFHDERNTRTRFWRKGSLDYEHTGALPMPYARLDGGRLGLHLDDEPYSGIGLIRASALAELLDNAYAPFDARLKQSHRVSELLVETFAREAADRGIRFVLAGISRAPETRSMLRFATERGIPVVEIATDLRRRVNRIHWDEHPSGAANEKSAGALARFILRLPSLAGS